jgi:mono/diheme cytochrome c family protein
MIRLRMRSARGLFRLGLLGCGCALAVSGLLRSARAAQPAATATPLQSGKAVYEQRCAYCHGTSGRGDGPVAASLHPRPLDFTAGRFKLRTTESGSLPTDDDLNRTILEGIPGTSMPGWRGRLSIDDVRSVVAERQASRRRVRRKASCAAKPRTAASGARRVTARTAAEPTRSRAA